MSHAKCHENAHTLEDLFESVDTNKTGILSADQLMQVMKIFGEKLTMDDVTNLIAKFDVDNKGGVNLHQFNVILATLTRTPGAADDELRSALRVFDRNGNGFISTEELRTAMMNTGDKMSKEEVEDMLKAADTNGNGQIDYEEFFTLITQ